MDGVTDLEGLFPADPEREQLMAAVRDQARIHAIYNQELERLQVDERSRAAMTAAYINGMMRHVTEKQMRNGGLSP